MADGKGTYSDPYQMTPEQYMLYIKGLNIQEGMIPKGQTPQGIKSRIKDTLQWDKEAAYVEQRRAQINHIREMMQGPYAALMRHRLAGVRGEGRQQQGENFGYPKSY